MTNIHLLSRSARILNILMQIESIFDDSGLYVFDGWIDGEIIISPQIKGKWVYLVLKYEKMPDTRGLDIFDTLKIRYRFCKKKKKIYYKDLIPSEIQNAVGYGYINSLPLEQTPKPVTVDVYILYLLIPKKLIDYIFVNIGDEVLDPEEEEYYSETREQTSSEEEIEGNKK
jgi:hypothetical protein